MRVWIGKYLPDSAVEDMGSMIDEFFAPGVFHTNLHEFFEGGVISVVPVLELIEVGLKIGG